MKTAAAPVPLEDRAADPDELAAFNAVAKPTRGSVGSVSTPTWRIPGQIRAELPAVEAFDAETMLPEALRSWILDEANRMPCAPDLIAAPVIVALGALIGARCAIRPKAMDDWAIVPNLWGAVVALPSAKKSPAIATALRPLDRLIAKAAEAHETSRVEHQARELIHKAREETCAEAIKAATKGKVTQVELDCLVAEFQAVKQATPGAPTPKRFRTNDSTVEKLVELLRDNPNGLLVLRDELVGLIASWDREGRESDKAFFLEAWNGSGSFSTDRIGRGSLLVPNLCLSVFGGIQPDKLTMYLEETARSFGNDGMLQRFQVIVYPDPGAWEYRDQIPDAEARAQAYRVFDAIADCDPVAFGAEPADEFAKRPCFRFAPDAQSVFVEWTSELHQKRLNRDDHPLVNQHLTKFDKLFPALALIFHLIDVAAGALAGPVSRTAALRAAAWCEYLESHARRCYGLLLDDGLRAAQALAGQVKKGRLADGFTARDVSRNQWRYLTTAEAIRAALEWLEDDGWLRGIQDPPGAGRPTVRYTINPAVRKVAVDE
jgi:hypothetical protein